VLLGLEDDLFAGQQLSIDVGHDLAFFSPSRAIVSSGP
jgi:hypothetical protein